MPPKVLSNMNNILTDINNYKNCITIKCKKEEDQFKKNKYSIEIEKLKQDLKNGKIDLIKFNNEIAKLKFLIIKGKYRDDLFKCQLKDCYNETSDMLKSTIENILIKSDKNSQNYKLASKYKKIFETNKITSEYINNLEMDIHKLKLNNKKVVLSFPKLIPEHLKNDMKNMLDAVLALSSCLKTKCKIEQEQSKKTKLVIEMEKLMFNFQENLKNGNVDYKKFNNKIDELKIKIMKEKESKDLVNCQLKNCYNESVQTLKLSFESILALGDKKTKEYKFALKYKKILETKKLTAEHLNKLGVEMMKLNMI